MAHGAKVLVIFSMGAVQWHLVLSFLPGTVPLCQAGLVEDLCGQGLVVKGLVG